MSTGHECQCRGTIAPTAALAAGNPAAEDLRTRTQPLRKKTENSMQTMCQNLINPRGGDVKPGRRQCRLAIARS